MSFQRRGAWSANGIKLEVGQVVIYAGAISKCRVQRITDKRIYLEVIEPSVGGSPWLPPSATITVPEVLADIGHVYKTKSPGLIWVLEVPEDKFLVQHPLEGTIVTCSKGHEFLVEGRKQLPWGLAWVGKDANGKERSSRHPAFRV